MQKPHITQHPKNNSPRPSDLKAGDDDDAAISVTFTNFSATQWSLDYWGWDYQEGFSGPSSEPSDPLDANDGLQTFAQSQVLSWLDQGPISIFCTWRDPNGYRFGINLVAHFQFLSIGKRPDYSVSTDHNATIGSEPSWQEQSDPAAPYTWDENQIPYNIIATPNSGHTSLSIAVQINDLPQA